MNRTEALSLLKENLTNKNLFNHSLAVEAVMRRLAGHSQDVEKWGLAGHTISTTTRPKTPLIPTALRARKC